VIRSIDERGKSLNDANLQLIKFCRTRNASLSFVEDDASVVGGARLALRCRMAKKSLEERVSAIEAQLGGKTLQEHFREQAELIDRLFAYRFGEMDKRFGERMDRRFGEMDKRFGEKMDKRFEEMDERWNVKLDAKFESNLAPIRSDLAAVKDALKIILTRLN
jgi:uncharacterized protein YukE